MTHAINQITPQRPNKNAASMVLPDGAVATTPDQWQGNVGSIPPQGILLFFQRL